MFVIYIIRDFILLNIIIIIIRFTTERKLITIISRYQV